MAALGWGERSGSAYVSSCQRDLAEYIMHFAVCCCCFLGVVVSNDESDKIRGIFWGSFGKFSREFRESYLGVFGVSRGVLLKAEGSFGEL